MRQETDHDQDGDGDDDEQPEDEENQAGMPLRRFEPEDHLKASVEQAQEGDHDRQHQQDVHARLHQGSRHAGDVEVEFVQAPVIQESEPEDPVATFY